MGVLGAIGTSMKLSVARNPRWTDTVTSAQRIDVSPWELFMMNCLIPGLIPFLIDGSMMQQCTILRGWLGNSDCWTSAPGNYKCMGEVCGCELSIGLSILGQITLAGQGRVGK